MRPIRRTLLVVTFAVLLSVTACVHDAVMPQAPRQNERSGVPAAFGMRLPAARGSALGRYGAPWGTELAVLRAMRWLTSVQNEDGSWSADAGGGLSSQKSPAAMTSLALLAFLGGGKTPDHAEFGFSIDRGLKWLVAAQTDEGRFRGSDGHEYALPITAMALCDAYGMTGDKGIKKAAMRAIGIIVAGTNEEGGWNYNCDREGRNDTSYSGWCAQAVLAARDANLPVPGIEQARLKAIQGFKATAAESGGFAYTSTYNTIGGRLTGVGVSCLQRLGEPRCPEVKRGIEWIDLNADTKWEKQGRRPFYYWYYETQATFQSGGDRWKSWNASVMANLVKHQRVLKGAGIDEKDIGYWESIGDKENFGYVYNTALCTMMLEVYYRHPRVQRR